MLDFINLSPSQNFVVVDTEGRYELSEIAMINPQGRVIYEAFVEGERNNHLRFKLKSLPIILQDFFNLAQSRLIVCHYAQHDAKVLKTSFKKTGIPWPKFNFCCSLEWTKRYFPDLPSYSLEYLSKRLSLKVDNKYFNANFAHSAQYDAAFTYQLYLKILEQNHATTLRKKTESF